MKTLFALIFTTLLSACGFHLKGTQYNAVLPVAVWHLEGDAYVQQALVQALYSSGAKVKQGANAEIKIVSVEYGKDIYTITRAAKLNEYLLRLQVVVQVHRNGQAWGEPMQLQTKRVMRYSDSEILGKQDDEQTLWREMREDIATQIVHRLAFLPR